MTRGQEELLGILLPWLDRTLGISSAVGPGQREMKHPLGAG